MDIGDYFLFSLLSLLVYFGIPILTIIGIIWFFKRKNKNIKDPTTNPQWYLSPFLSKDDTLSQFLFLVSYCLLPGLLNVYNRMLPNPLEWQHILIIWALLGIVLAIVFKNIVVMLVSICSLFVGVTAQLAIWTDKQNIQTIFMAPYLLGWCAMIYSLSSLFHIRKYLQRFYLIYAFLGMIGTLAIIFLFSTKSGISLFSFKASTTDQPPTAAILLILFTILAVTTAATVLGYVKKLLHPYESIVLIGLIVTVLVMMVTPPSPLQISTSYYSYSSDVNNLTGEGFLWALWYNLLALLLPVGVIISGIQKHESWRINIGMISIFLIVIIKYFDWFFTFMDKSLFFIIAGVLLLGMGYFLERGRRYLLKEAKKQEAVSNTI